MCEKGKQTSLPLVSCTRIPGMRFATRALPSAIKISVISEGQSDNFRPASVPLAFAFGDSLNDLWMIRPDIDEAGRYTSLFNALSVTFFLWIYA